MIQSPITGGSTTLIGTIKTATLSQLYAPYVPVSHFFRGLTEIEIHECIDTGYRFYYPFTVAGDGPFYEALAKEELYYIPWKWEHEVADNYIKEGDTVLELGCATGDFLIAEMQRKKIKPYGTELNDTARKTAEARGVSFASATNVDLTCAFQVLEHIADVQGFMGAAVTATRPGGHIVMGVPNNDCFMKNDPTCFLNMPPHHMGLWTEASLRAIAPHFGLDVVDIRTEHLQPHHFRYYYQVRFGDRFRRFGVFGKVFNKLVYELFGHGLIALRAKHILGHTIVAVYKKRHG